ncbi:hypothetical protein GCM10007415_42560 [Parapedobacter pyrenivorans]|uniref:Uncharacterized protein n=1 Tax=Parapedobacter pyrenivorans TaxID=1305674 RepID=A0A917I2C8_9SPHI|nr:hypothetical protein GCM10007415_42560 [Parapedobacter pyrenivorans]
MAVPENQSENQPILNNPYRLVYFAPESVVHIGAEGDGTLQSRETYEYDEKEGLVTEHRLNSNNEIFLCT